MTTTEHRQVPDWLDLDKIIPPETQAEIVATIDELRALLPTAGDLARRVHRLWALQDGMLDVGRADDFIVEVSGLDELHELATLIGTVISDACGGVAGEGLYEKLIAQYGDALGGEVPQS